MRRGPTTLSNLAMLCRRHHRAVHEEGYRVDRPPDGDVVFRRPDGRVIRKFPPQQPYRLSPLKSSAHATAKRVSAFTRAPHAQPGSASVSTSAGRCASSTR